MNIVHSQCLFAHTDLRVLSMLSPHEHCVQRERERRDQKYFKI